MFLLLIQGYQQRLVPKSQVLSEHLEDARETPIIILIWQKTPLFSNDGLENSSIQTAKLLKYFCGSGKIHLIRGSAVKPSVIAAFTSSALDSSTLLTLGSPFYSPYITILSLLLVLVKLLMLHHNS